MVSKEDRTRETRPVDFVRLGLDFFETVDGKLAITREATEDLATQTLWGSEGPPGGRRPLWERAGLGKRVRNCEWGSVKGVRAGVE